MPFKSRTGTRCVLHIFYDIYIYICIIGYRVARIVYLEIVFWVTYMYY